MADLSASIAEMLTEGGGLTKDDHPRVMVDRILDRWPDATMGEIERGLLIAIEMGEVDIQMASRLRQEGRG